MTLRKITVDHSLRNIPITEKTKETDIKPKKQTPLHFLVNKTKKFQKNLKSSFKT